MITFVLGICSVLIIPAQIDLTCIQVTDVLAFSPFFYDDLPTLRVALKTLN